MRCELIVGSCYVANTRRQTCSNQHGKQMLDTGWAFGCVTYAHWVSGQGLNVIQLYCIHTYSSLFHGSMHLILLPDSQWSRQVAPDRLTTLTWVPSPSQHPSSQASFLCWETPEFQWAFIGFQKRHSSAPKVPLWLNRTREGRYLPSLFHATLGLDQNWLWPPPETMLDAVL